MTVFEKIAAQQTDKENTPAWMVGEQLKEICADPACAQLVEADIDAITLANVAGKIKAWADAEHKKAKTQCICVPPQVAERIIREAYGLPAAGTKAPEAAPAQESKAPAVLSLEDFL